MTAKAAQESRSLDELFDMAVSRPLGRGFARAVSSTPLTANHVSIMAGVCFAMPWPYPSLGGAWMTAFIILDCADGELARIKGGGGWRGRMIDGWSDVITAFATHLGMVLYLSRQQVDVVGFVPPFIGVFVLGCIAGASHSWNSGVLDAMKQSLKESSVDRERTKIVCDANGLVDRILWWSFQFYVSRLDYSRHADYGVFRRVQWVGPTHHSVLMVLSSCLVGIWPQAFYGYFLFSIVPMNLYLAAVLWHARRTQSGALVA